MTFTPLKGMSTVVRRFLTEDAADRGYIQMRIEDAEHYSAEECARIIASYPPRSAHQRSAELLSPQRPSLRRASCPMRTNTVR